MANRHKNFDKLVASQFKDEEFSQFYIMNLINEEKMNLDDALRETIISMGLQSFSDKAGISIQYVSDFINKRRKLTTETINKYLERVFNLKIKLSVEPIDKKVA